MYSCISVVTTLLKEEDISIINMINKFGYDKTTIDDIERYDLIMFPEFYAGKTGYDINLINIAKQTILVCTSKRVRWD